MRVAKAIIYDHNGKALLLRRSGTHPRYAYEPDLPGGIIEIGERYEDGLAREIVEEVGIILTTEQLVLIGERSGLTTKRLYEVRLNEQPNIYISWEHDLYEWVEPSELKQRLASHDSFMTFVQTALKP